ncbi:MAG: hypothetical protein ABR511_05710 [Acidimicrobiales bacterium]
MEGLRPLIVYVYTIGGMDADRASAPAAKGVDDPVSSPGTCGVGASRTPGPGPARCG